MQNSWSQSECKEKKTLESLQLYWKGTTVRERELVLIRDDDDEEEEGVPTIPDPWSFNR